MGPVIGGEVGLSEEEEQEEEEEEELEEASGESAGVTITRGSFGALGHLGVWRHDAR